MLEQEIKLHVPPGAVAGARGQLAHLAGPRRSRLRAMYFDTPDRQLARRQIALRLRLEGRRWVQTLKMAGGDALTRYELNHPRPAPVLDLSVYADTPVAERMLGVQGELVVHYETDIMRLVREVRVRQGVVEVVFDQGEIRAGELAVPVAEMEFELRRGRTEAVFVVAERWRKAHNLVVDLRSKAERGDNLAQAWLAASAHADPDDRKAAAWRHYFAPRRQSAIKLEADHTAEQALRAVSAECLDQITRNAALVLGTDGHRLAPHDQQEALHQWRVGIRRLRSAWRLFRDLTPLPPTAWRDQAAEAFRQAGQGRDDHIFRHTILPAIEAAGMPAMPRTAGSVVPDPDSTAMLAEADWQAWQLNMVGWTVLPPVAPPRVQEPTDSSAGPDPLATLLARRLRKWHRRVVKDGTRFAELSDDERHEVRKLVKRLRYGIGFAESLLPGKRVKPYRAQLAQVQSRLGDYNDLVAARDRLLGVVHEYPQAWFGVGWLTATLAPMAREAAHSIEILAECRSFWGKRLER